MEESLHGGNRYAEIVRIAHDDAVFSHDVVHSCVTHDGHAVSPRERRRSISLVVVPRLSIPSKRPLLVFDGDCAFCTTWVNRLRGVLPRFPEAVPYQWIDHAELGLDEHDVTRYVWYVGATRQLAGHLALSALLRAQRGPWWRFAGWILATPPFSWLAALGYRFVSRFRHRLPGGTPACALPPGGRG